MATSKDQRGRAQKKTAKSPRKGDTSRTSSQERKQSSGGTEDKRGNPEIDENTKSPKSGK